MPTNDPNIVRLRDSYDRLAAAYAENLGVAVDLDFVFWETATVERELREAGFAIEAKLERSPYEGHEHPSRRVYLFARRA